ncbi:MAG: DUF695 domain-containing protein [Clostridia bacterium]
MSDGFLEYDWHFEGKSAIFGVDMGLSAPDSSRPILIKLQFSDFNSETLKSSVKRKTETFKNKCTKVLSMTYAGFMEYGGVVVYFFYASSKATISNVEELLKKAHLSGFTCDCSDDPSWLIYFKQLYPTQEKFQTEENRKMIALYKKNGDKLDVPRRIAFHAFFPTEPLRVLFSEEARINGYAIGETAFVPEYEESHGVSVYKISPLKKLELDILSTDIIRIARRYEGRLIGWDAARK